MFLDGNDPSNYISNLIDSVASSLLALILPFKGEIPVKPISSPPNGLAAPAPDVSIEKLPLSDC